MSKNKLINSYEKNNIWELIERILKDRERNKMLANQGENYRSCVFRKIRYRRNIAMKILEKKIIEFNKKKDYSDEQFSNKFTRS